MRSMMARYHKMPKTASSRKMMPAALPPANRITAEVHSKQAKGSNGMRDEIIEVKNKMGLQIDKVPGQTLIW